MLLSGCQQPTSGSNTIENGGNTNGGNEQTEKFYGTPYTKAIGNGNYTLHNYTSDYDNMQAETVVADVNHYLGLAETYNKGLVNDFETSLANRPAAQNYFYEYTNAALGNEYNNIENRHPGGSNFDFLININNLNSKYIFADIIKNLPTVDERYAFRECYRILANEAYKEGLGTSRNGSNSYMTKYQKEKDSIKLYINISQSYGYPSFQNIDLEQEYGANNFVNITNLLDSLIDTATPT